MKQPGARPVVRCRVALALVALPLSVAVPQDDPPLLEEHSKVRVREVRLRILPEPLAPAGACLTLGLDDLKVTVRGRPVDPALLLELDRERGSTLHAMLIDSSQSAAGKLDCFRRAAADYVRTLRPGIDHGMVAVFDESVVLLQPPTSSHEALIEAIGRLRMGGATAMNDGLYFMMRELEAHRTRPVILLITDGFDTASVVSRSEVNALAEGRPDLTVFTIGVGMPPLMAGGPPGMLSTRRFLQRLAARTNGRYFELGTGSRLGRVFARIREMLDSEALLTFVDPDAEAQPGKIRVKTRNPDCNVETFHTRESADTPRRLAPILPPFAEIPRTLALDSGVRYRKFYRSTGRGALDPDCVAPRPVDDGGESRWFVDVEARSMRGCALDITMETGLLYDAGAESRLRDNEWLKLKTRPFEIAVPSLDELPTRPEQLMPTLADRALALADEPVETDPRQVPVEDHARPYHDHPLLQQGTVFFDTRATLARGLFSYAEYRAWVQDRLRDEARLELEALQRRLRRRAPERRESDLREVARLSSEGREILRRSEHPSAVELQEYLSAWLGDITAHELFVRWEMDRINSYLQHGGTGELSVFRERWRALHKTLFVPSYTRILTLLSLVHDRERERIGYWRVVLPRASWMLRRVKGYKRRTDYANLPLDLVPDLPLGLWVVEGLIGRTSGPLPRRVEDFELLDLRYELLGKPYRHDAKRGFRHVRVVLVLRPLSGGGPIRVAAEVTTKRGRPSLEKLHLSSVSRRLGRSGRRSAPFNPAGIVASGR